MTIVSEEAAQKMAVATGTLTEAPVPEAGLAQLLTELDEQLAWAKRRHDVEMRTAAQRRELGRLLDRLQSVLACHQRLLTEGVVVACAPPTALQHLHASVEAVRHHLGAVGQEP